MTVKVTLTLISFERPSLEYTVRAKYEVSNSSGSKVRSKHHFIWSEGHISPYPRPYDVSKMLITFKWKSWFRFGSFNIVLCRLRSIAAHRDHFVRRLSVCSLVCLVVTLLTVVTHCCFAGDTCIPRNVATMFEYKLARVRTKTSPTVDPNVRSRCSQWTWFLVHLCWKLKCTIVIMRCPSSVVVNFSYFRLLLWNHWTEFNETWQEARIQRPLPSLCFWADRNNKMAALASDWLTHFRLLVWKRWTEFNETWQEAGSQSLCFSGRSEKQDVRPGLWLVKAFSTSPLKRLNGFQRYLTGSKITMSSTKFVFFRADRKNKMAALACDWLRHFRLLL